LRQRDPVARTQIDGRSRPLERDIHGLYPIDLPHGHAHGVGADRSIHAEDLQVDAAKLRLRQRWRNQQ